MKPRSFPVVRSSNTTPGRNVAGASPPSLRSARGSTATSTARRVSDAAAMAAVRTRGDHRPRPLTTRAAGVEGVGKADGRAVVVEEGAGSGGTLGPGRGPPDVPTSAVA